MPPVFAGASKLSVAWALPALAVTVVGAPGAAGVGLIIRVGIAQYILKTSWEVLATPLTYAIVGFLKRREHQDHYDVNTNFNPFRVRV